MPRNGFLTPSTFRDLMTNDRSGKGMGKTAQNVIDQHALDLLGVEREDMDLFTPASCQWGKDNEWQAIQTYEDRTMREVRQPEFAVCPTHPYVGGTMDGLVGDKGGIEVKCPYSSIEHLYNAIEARQAVKVYNWQMQGYMWIRNLDWIDFVSFDPRFPAPVDLVVHKIERDEVAIQALIDRCEAAHEMAVGIVNTLRRICA